VTRELHAQGKGVGGGPDVEDAAAHGKFAFFRNFRGAGIAGGDEVGDQGVQVGLAVQGERPGRSRNGVRVGHRLLQRVGGGDQDGAGLRVKRTDGQEARALQFAVCVASFDGGEQRDGLTGLAGEGEQIAGDRLLLDRSGGDDQDRRGGIEASQSEGGERGRRAGEEGKRKSRDPRRHSGKRGAQSAGHAVTNGVRGRQRLAILCRSLRAASGWRNPSHCPRVPRSATLNLETTIDCKAVRL
jgi:hypothetical protein